jgi:hypothetical protein
MAIKETWQASQKQAAKVQGLTNQSNLLVGEILQASRISAFRDVPKNISASTSGAYQLSNQLFLFSPGPVVVRL